MIAIESGKYPNDYNQINQILSSNNRERVDMPLNKWTQLFSPSAPSAGL